MLLLLRFSRLLPGNYKYSVCTKEKRSLGRNHYSTWQLLTKGCFRNNYQERSPCTVLWISSIWSEKVSINQELGYVCWWLFDLVCLDSFLFSVFKWNVQFLFFISLISPHYESFPTTMSELHSSGHVQKEFKAGFQKDLLKHNASCILCPLVKAHPLLNFTVESHIAHFLREALGIFNSVKHHSAVWIASPWQPLKVIQAQIMRNNGDTGVKTDGP